MRPLARGTERANCPLARLCLFPFHTRDAEDLVAERGLDISYETVSDVGAVVAGWGPVLVRITHEDEGRARHDRGAGADE